ncbi:glycosyltransferase family 4 protein [Pelagibacterium halotolerans]|uniref:glycosyltransferase family 4 protein n=1 Tax=Pelagibacterium halotolerans TaxID=531813 RepID=UPI00385116D0
MRILHVMRAPVGGLFRHVADLTAALSERGHQVGIVADSLSGDAATEAKLEKLKPYTELGIHRLPIPRLLGAQDIATPWRIWRLARSLGIDVLHGHGAKGGFAARVAGLWQNAAVTLYTPHGGALHFDQKTPSGALFMTIERGLLAATDAVVFESAHAERVFGEKVARPKCVTRVIHNGLVEAEFVPIAPPEDAADFVFVGELRQLKGIDLLVEALAPLRRPDGTPATLVVAGDGPDADALRAQIAALGVTNRVTLAGVQPAREMFARGRCVVVPSRAESLPYIVLEAAAAERPVIATDVGGISEIFGPQADRLIEPDSKDALEKAMAAFLAEPGRYAEDAAALRSFVHEGFSVSRMTDGIEALYTELRAGR